MSTSDPIPDKFTWSFIYGIICHWVAEVPPRKTSPCTSKEQGYKHAQILWTWLNTSPTSRRISKLNFWSIMWHNESLDCRRLLSITVENGRVTPLFKKHDKSKNEYYRPVTVLPALNNIFKRLLSFQTSKFYNSILFDFILAYRRQHTVAAARHHWLDWPMIGGVALTTRRLLLLYPWTCQRHLTPFPTNF